MGTIIGLRDLHYAILVEDTSTAVSYETPVKIAGAVQANINPNPSMETLFADDGPSETAATLGQIELEIVAKDFPIEVQAALLGHSVVGGVMIRKSTDVPPWVAIGFKSLKSNGFYRYVWLLKGKFQVPEQNHETKGDRVNFQTPTLRGVFVRRDFDDAWQKQTDEDYVDYVPAIGTNWFLDVQGSPDVTPPTVVVSPADGDTGVAVGANITWTFNEPIKASLVTAANFMVIKAADGTVVPGTLSINGQHTIVTFDPTNNLEASAPYIAICTTNVTDVAGNALAATSVTNFTTA